MCSRLFVAACFVHTRPLPSQIADRASRYSASLYYLAALHIPIYIYVYVYVYICVEIAFLNSKTPMARTQTSRPERQAGVYSLDTAAMQSGYLQPKASSPTRNWNVPFSPVNENGSFESDRVLKCSKVYRLRRNKHVSADKRTLAPLLANNHWTRPS